MPKINQCLTVSLSVWAISKLTVSERDGKTWISINQNKKYNWEELLLVFGIKCPLRVKRMNKKSWSHLVLWAVTLKSHLQAAQLPNNRWVDIIIMGHLHNGILLGHKKEENFTLCNSMDEFGEYFAKWNMPVRER